MRLVLLRIVIAFSVILAGMHLPATAHAQDVTDHGLHHDHHASHADDASDKKGDVPVDVGTDIMHHHHCPMGVDPAPVVDLAPMPISKSLVVPTSSAALHSRATAPPLQPPLA